MPLPNPTFIPIRRKEAHSVSSWRSTSPEPVADDTAAFLRIALVQPITVEAVLPIVTRIVGNDTFHTFTVGPTLQIPTKRKAAEPSATAAAGGNAALSPSLASQEGEASPNGGEENGAAADDDDDDEMVPPMSLPPTLSNVVPMLVFRLPKLQVAEEVKRAVSNIFPNAIMSLTLSENDQKLPTLILKGLPFNIAAEQFLGYLETLTTRPCHIRLSRSDRGMFKCIMFVKYPTAISAEIARIELERLHHMNRAIKIEHKKRARRYIASDPSVEETSHVQLTDLVNELKVSKENEAFSFPKGVLSKEEQKFLKGLCQSHDLVFEATESVVVRRKNIPAPDRSPSIRPASATPPWQVATPGSLAPKDGLNFRGASGWKAAREGNGTFKLGQGLSFVRPVGPGDVPAFAAGRGRPVLT